MGEKSPRLVVTFYTTAQAHRHRAALPPPGAGGQTDLRSPVHHIRLRHGLVRAAGAAGAPGDPAAGGRDRDSRFYELPL